MKRTPLQRKTALKPGGKGLRRTGFRRLTLEEVREKQKDKREKLSLKRSGPIRGKRNHSRDKADRLWQEIQHILWGHRCARCGKKLIDKEGRWLGSAHHMVKRRILHLRHSLNNGILGCDDCHIYASDSWENAPDIFEAWLKEHHRAHWRWLEEHRYEDGHKPDWQEVCIELETVLESLKKGA
jgi:hypothetical protein